MVGEVLLSKSQQKKIPKIESLQNKSEESAHCALFFFPSII